MKTATISIHESQFPENVRCDLIASLRTRKINHKFHYDSVKQTQKWLALHQAIYSPSRNDADCAATYGPCVHRSNGNKSNQNKFTSSASVAAVGKKTRQETAEIVESAGQGNFFTRRAMVSTAFLMVLDRAPGGAGGGARRK